MRADSCAGTRPENRGAAETAGGERDAANALQQKVDDGERTDEDGRGDGRSGEIDKRSFLAATTRRARAGQAEPRRGHEERIPGETRGGEGAVRVVAYRAPCT